MYSERKILINTERTQYISPLTMIANAMMETQAFLLNPVCKNPNKYITEVTLNNIDLLEKILENFSRNLCEEASAITLKTLISKHPLAFDHMAILKTYKNLEKPLVNPLWNFHAYFLVRDINLTWYAGSPANHEANKPDSPMTRIIYSKNLQEVVNEIQEKDRGDWPDSDYIQQAFAENNEVMPQIRSRYKNSTFSISTIKIIREDGSNFSLIDDTFCSNF